MFKKLLIFIVSVSFIGQSKAQLTVNNSFTAQQLVNNVLLGNGVTVSNITFNGSPTSIGRFQSNGSNLGLGSGVVLAAGDATMVQGPNNSGSFSSIGSGGSDPDLDLLTSSTSEDATVIEFDFIPSADTISFRYIFGSEEYNEYVCSNFNDVFGFFLSGPGITGPFSNNAINIATLPGTTTPVSIGTVNNGNSGTNGNPANCIPGGMTNTQYFVDNALQSSDPLQIQLDGFTVPLTASYPVVCGLTYHIKIAVSDVFDSSFDSAVFLEAESFASGGLDVTTATLSGDSIISEGCTGAAFVFSRVDTTTTDTITVVIGGTATVGSDFDPIPTELVFEAGEDTIVLPVTVLQDGIFEGSETLTVTVSFVTECGNTVTRQGVLFIVDTVLISTAPDTFIVQCNTDSFFVTVAPTNGSPPYSYVWSTGDTGDTIWFSSAQDTFVTVQITDFCGNTSGVDTVYVQFQLLAPFVAFIDGPEEVTLQCNQNNLFPSGQALGGLAPYTFLWSNGDQFQFPFYFINQTQYVWFQATDQCNVTFRDSILVTYISPDVPVVTLSMQDTTISCPFTDNFLLSANVDYQGVFDYQWNNGISGFGTTTVTPITQAPILTTQYFLSINECGRTTISDTVTVTVTVPPPPTVIINDPPSVPCIGVPVQLTSEVIGGTQPINYNWISVQAPLTPPNGQPTITATVNSTSSQVTLFVTDACHTTPVQASVGLPIVTPPPVQISFNDTTPHCAGDEITIVASVSQGAEPYKFYNWLHVGGNGTPTDSITNVVIDSDTTFVIEITDACNAKVKDSVTITLPVYQPLVVTSNNDSVYCAADSVLLNATIAGGDSVYTFGWYSDGVMLNELYNYSTVINEPDTVVYIFKAEDGCGLVAYDTVTVGIKPCEIQESNVLTPNGDGKNDLFILPNAQYYESNILYVYDRWGMKVFESANYKNDWDGGKLKDGIYFWILEPTTVDQGPFTGFLYLVR